MEAFAVSGMPEVEEGDDLASLIEEHADLREGDILLVASTVVSKAEGRLFDLADFPAGPRAREIANRLGDLAGEEKDPRFAQAVLEESTELITEAPFLLTETRFGHVGVNAGIDRSNVRGADLLLLPTHPSESAERIRERLSVDVPVVVTDTCGRPFRHGHELEVTVQNVIDELAATANLLMGEGSGGDPAVVVRDWAFGDHDGSQNLFRDLEGDFVRQALREWSYDPE